jgi:hypothetical protein
MIGLESPRFQRPPIAPVEWTRISHNCVTAVEILPIHDLTFRSLREQAKGSSIPVYPDLGLSPTFAVAERDALPKRNLAVVLEEYAVSGLRAKLRLGLLCFLVLELFFLLLLFPYRKPIQAGCLY